MNKYTSLLAAAITSLVIGLGFATASNAQSPPTNEQEYCQLLLKELRNYGWGTVRGNPVGNATAVAIAQCQEGNPGPAIPVLEEQMRDRKIPLPSKD